MDAASATLMRPSPSPIAQPQAPATTPTPTPTPTATTTPWAPQPHGLNDEATATTVQKDVLKAPVDAAEPALVAELTELKALLVDTDAELTELKALLAATAGELAELQKAAAAKEREVARLEALVAGKVGKRAMIEEALATVKGKILSKKRDQTIIICCAAGLVVLFGTIVSYVSNLDWLPSRGMAQPKRRWLDG